MIFGGGMVALLAGAAFWRLAPRKLGQTEFEARYSLPLAPPEKALSVFHLGHSLVGRDMPVMLDQLADAAGFSAHSHASQLGWGASLDQHRKGPEAVAGFTQENAHPMHKEARGALLSGQYDVVVMTEMVDIQDAIRHHGSANALAYWATFARAANPQVRLYLYETWHQLDDAEGWLERIDADFTRAWQDALLRVAMADQSVGTIHVIPGGQVLAAASRAIEAGVVPGLTRREGLFAQDETGAVDPIHLNDLGAYLIALTHFAVLYHQNPQGLPGTLLRADGRAATPLPDAALEPLQRLVWQVVTRYAFTGVAR